MSLSRETITVALELLGQVQLSGADPDLEAKTARVLAARSELTAALAEIEETDP